jgi:hypothetical protein
MGQNLNQLTANALLLQRWNFFSPFYCAVTLFLGYFSFWSVLTKKSWSCRTI